MTRPASVPPEIPNFAFVKTLGAGGFSDVYLYKQLRPERLVAVKVLLTDGLTAASTNAFIAEANTMAQLDHPFIASIYQADVADDGRPYLIMQYFSGQTLAERYKRQPLSVADALRVGVQLSSAIATAHAAGILHRDIKPANVLMNDYGRPALTDFGISSAVEEELPSHTTTREALANAGGTTASQSVGMSVPYSPPEMFEDDPQPDVRSDVFSLAATIYTLLAGRTPFEVAGRQNQMLDLMSRIERGAVTPMERTDVPGSLVAVLRKGMSTERERRFSTALEFARALQRVEVELSYAPTPIEAPGVMIEPLQKDATADPLDETRARGVTTIVAQPTSAPAPIIRGVSQVAQRHPIPQPGGVAEATVVRRSPRVESGLAPSNEVVDKTVIRSPAPVQVADANDDAKSRPKRKLALALVGGAIALVTTAVIIFSIAVAPAPAPTDDATGDAAPIGDGQSAAGSDVIPSVADVVSTRSADGTSVSFTWTNPGGETGDEFKWQRSDGSGEYQAALTPDPAAQVDGVTANTIVCIEVSVKRGNKLSADPQEVCTP